jgi:nucleotide-binding universal stress UspA family protein
MFETVLLATDGSGSVQRAVEVALDIARRFDADVHAVYVVDTAEVSSSPEELREELHVALEENGEETLATLRDHADQSITTEILEGRPSKVICTYAREHHVDVVAMGTRGRHGEDRFLLGSVAERVVRSCPVPVLTVRQLEDGY